MEQAKVQNLALTAARSRLLALDMVYGAASGHIGGSLSSLDILTTLYFHVMRVSPDAPQAPERDRFVLSRGTARRRSTPLWPSGAFFHWRS